MHTARRHISRFYEGVEARLARAQGESDVAANHDLAADWRILPPSPGEFSRSPHLAMIGHDNSPLPRPARALSVMTSFPKTDRAYALDPRAKEDKIKDLTFWPNGNRSCRSGRRWSS
jgi:hypothetical protein